MSYSIYILLLLNLLGLHDIPIATFDVYSENNQVYTTINIDTIDYFKATKSNMQNLSCETLEIHLNNTVHFYFDLKPTKITLLEFDIDNRHIRVTALLEHANSYSHIIFIRNTFLKNIKNHSNLINLTGKSNTRGFRMHKDRTEIEIIDFESFK